MQKITIGKKRKKTNVEIAGNRRAADAVFVFGAAAVCVMLALPLIPAEETATPERDAAVMVMSGAVSGQTRDLPGREELTVPSAAEEEEWNLYDYIGELFAGLISGQG